MAAILWLPADGFNVPPVPPAGLSSRCGLTAGELRSGPLALGAPAGSLPGE